MTELRVCRGDIARCDPVDTGPPGQPGDGETLLRVERFALSANNVTYATMGDALRYWQLFPAPPGWGLVPAWGYATVVGSRAAGVAEGDRLFGLVPMAGHLLVHPAAGRAGFADTAVHRAALSPVYNRYLPVGDGNDLALVLRPLFGTSVLLDLLLAESGVPGPVVLTSASSKTAYGLAHLLAKRGRPVAGLTSPARVGWVRGLGLYDSVHAYDELPTLGAVTVLVDFAGDPTLLRRLHSQLGPTLRRSILVGFTHRRASADSPAPPGPAPEFFFAPDEMARRGRALAPAYAEAWAGFAPVAARTVRLERVSGAHDLATVWRNLVAGRTDPAAGYVASL